MDNTCCATNNDTNNSNDSNNNDKNDILLNGVSVYHMKNYLLKEVDDDDDLDVNTAKIYQLEPNLRSSDRNDFGLIRRKGADITCPRDKKLGAAYVDSIEQCDDFVGHATVMLSYTWGYGIKSVVDTLVAKCAADGLDMKRTYVWICCLCNNQHRIGNTVVPFEEFRKTFYGTVTGVGKLWSMMSPWDDPLYLKRVWCVFEIYVANTESEVEAEIIMPEDEEGKLVKSLHDFNKLLDVLSKTKIENAEASVESDKKNILDLVRNTIGVDELNVKVNALLREWITDVLVKVAEQDKTKSDDDLDHAKILREVGWAFFKMGNYDKAMENYTQSLAISERVLGEKEDAGTGACYNGIGLVKWKKDDLDGALDAYKKALAIRLKVLGNDHADTANSYSNIGIVKDLYGDLDDALDTHKKALAIRLKVLGNDHADTASSYSNIGLVKHRKGDYDGALDMFEKDLEICLKVLGSDHADTAQSYNNIGLAKAEKGDYKSALDKLQQALTICEKVLGTNHPSTIKTSKAIELVKTRMSDQQED